MSVVPQFSFTKSWTDASKFPTVETREVQVREDMQALFDEIRDYINNTLVTNGSGGAGVLDAANMPFSSSRSALVGQTNIKDAIEKVLDLAQQVVELSIGEGAVGHSNLQENCVWENNIVNGAVNLSTKTSGLLPLAKGGLAVDLSTAAGKGTARNTLGLGPLATYSSSDKIPLTMGGLNADLSNAAGKETARMNLGLGTCAIENTLPVTKGGTGAQTAENARSNLGLGSCAVESTLPVSKGGTGATSADSARTNLGLGSCAVESVLPIAKGGTGATTADGVRSNIGAQKQCTAYTTAEATITSSGVSVSCPGVTTTNHIVVTYNENYYNNWVNAGVHVTAQGNGTITLVSSYNVAIRANVLILD